VRPGTEEGVATADEIRHQDGLLFRRVSDDKDEETFELATQDAGARVQVLTQKVRLVPMVTMNPRPGCKQPAPGRRIGGDGGARSVAAREQGHLEPRVTNNVGGRLTLARPSGNETVFEELVRLWLEFFGRDDEEKISQTVA
jgi:hypothetical protein